MLKTEYRTHDGASENSRFCEMFIEKLNSLLEQEDTCGDTVFRAKFIEVRFGSKCTEVRRNCRCSMSVATMTSSWIHMPVVRLCRKSTGCCSCNSTTAR